MSRGLGAVERLVLEILNNSSLLTSWQTSSIVQQVAGRRTAGGADPVAWAQAALRVKPSPSLEASVGRALASLRRKGRVVQDDRRCWLLAEAQKREDRRRRKEERDERQERLLAEEQAKAAAERSPNRVLAKLLGMLGSDQEGEVLNAAKMIEVERRRLGRTWQELLSVSMG